MLLPAAGSRSQRGLAAAAALLLFLLISLMAAVAPAASAAPSQPGGAVPHTPPPHRLMQAASPSSVSGRPGAPPAAADGGEVRFLPKDFFRPDSELASLIIVANKSLAHQLQCICAAAPADPAEPTHVAAEAHVMAGAASSGDHGATSAAACSSLAGVCQRLYMSSVTGLSGRFNRQQFRTLQHCLGGDAIEFVERDGKVMKAEHGDHAGWWKSRAPQQLLPLLPQLLQQQGKPAQPEHDSGAIGSVLVKSFSGGNTNSSGWQQAANTTVVSVLATGDAPAANQMQPSAQQLWQWMLAEVGLAAQRQLAAGLPLTTSRGGMSQPAAPATVAVAALDGSSSAGDLLADVPPLMAAAEQGVAAQAVTKNQDPGVPVDYSAISNPEISAFQPVAGHDASAARSSSGSPSLEQPLDPVAAEAANRQPGVKTQRLVTALWNLDRVDQRALPLNGRFSYGSGAAPGTGKGVTIFTLDSGIKASHQEFQPWGQAGGGSSRARAGPDFVDDDDLADDCDGHGTHVASTAAGRSVGIAKEANVVAVRVLDCDGAGSISSVVAALDWVAANAQKPAVVSLSLGVPAGQWSRALEASVKHLVAAGIPVVVASGNDARDSCEVAPARVPEVITVGASNLPSKFSDLGARGRDNLYTYSNTGACVDVFAPGVDILGACGGPSRCETVTPGAYTWATGTSMAAPHVTGWVAVYLEAHPAATPAQVHDALLSAASCGLLQSDLMLAGTPNRLLFSGAGLDGAPVAAASGAAVGR